MVTCVFERETPLQSNLMGTFAALKIYIFEKVTSGGCLSLPRGYIHVYDHYF